MKVLRFKTWQDEVKRLHEEQIRFERECLARYEEKLIEVAHRYGLHVADVYDYDIELLNESRDQGYPGGDDAS